MRIQEALDLISNVPGLATDVGNEPEAAIDLCEKCGRHPLALTLAAHRLLRRLNDSSTPIATFVSSLENRLEQLRIGTLEAQISVEANLDLSYSELTKNDQRCFRALAVFSQSGFCLKAASAVWNQSEPQARATLERLQTLSLVTNATLPGRFRMHDLLHELAEARALTEGDFDVLQVRHAHWLISLSNQYSDTKEEMGDELVNEFENLIRAAVWARSVGDGATLARLITNSGTIFRALSQHWQEWKFSLQRAVELGLPNERLKAEVFSALGYVVRYVELFPKPDDLETAQRYYEQAIELFCKLEDWSRAAADLTSLGDLQFEKGKLQAAEQSYQRTLDLYRSQEFRKGEAEALKALGDVRKKSGNLSLAKDNYMLALDALQEQDTDCSTSDVLLALGDLYQEQNNLRDAERIYIRAVQLYKESGARIRVSETLTKLAQVQRKLCALKTSEQNLSLAAQYLKSVREKFDNLDPLEDMYVLSQFNSEMGGGELPCMRAYFMYQKLANPIETVRVLKSLADTQKEERELSRAAQSYTEALATCVEFRAEVGENLGKEFMMESMQSLIIGLSTVLAELRRCDAEQACIKKIRSRIESSESHQALEIFDSVLARCGDPEA
jgi:tetratricopeptide (TPR) repeat protein